MSARILNMPRARSVRYACVGWLALVAMPTCLSATASEQPPLVAAQPANVQRISVQVQGLQLSELLRAAASHNPSIRAARLEADASAQDVAAIERQRWPNFSLTAESNTGNSRSYPTTAAQVEQTVWDFGLMSARVAGAKTAASTGLVRAQLQHQDIYLQIVNAWQTLIGARQRAYASRQTVDRLQGFREQMTRRVASQASPPIDLELVDARVLQTQVELAIAENSIRVAINRLEQLSGLKGLINRVDIMPTMPGLMQTSDFANELAGIDLAQVALNSSVVARARLESEKVTNDLTVLKAQNFPTVYVRTYQPLNKTAAGVDLNTSMSTFLGLKYTPGAGFATALQTQALATRVSASQETVRTAAMEMEQTLLSDREEFFNARQRLNALERSVIGSANVLDSYQRQFEANRKTWLDLMNAVRELAQNEYALADTQAVLVGSMLRLQIRLGREPQ